MDITEAPLRKVTIETRLLGVQSNLLLAQTLLGVFPNFEGRAILAARGHRLLERSNEIEGDIEALPNVPQLPPSPEPLPEVVEEDEEEEQEEDEDGADAEDLEAPADDDEVEA